MPEAVMYQLYIANKNYSSWSLRPWLLMTQLGIPFQEHVNPFADGSNWEAFRKFSPSGKVPCLVDGDAVVWDSLAITEYLAESNPAVWPNDKRARAWARCAAAEMHSSFGSVREQCSMSCGIRVQLHVQSADLLKDIARLEELWAEGLNRFGGPFLSSTNFTAVDAFFAPIAFRAQTYQLPLNKVASDYVQRLLALPAMQSWYDAALAEPWREAAHEQHTLSKGVLLKDLRKSA